MDEIRFRWVVLLLNGVDEIEVEGLYSNVVNEISYLRFINEENCSCDEGFVE